MYDMTNLVTRYFKIKLKSGQELELEPPKLKVLKKISKLSKSVSNDELSEDDITNLSEAIALSLSKNKQAVNISSDYVEDNFDIDEMYDFLTNYYNWVGEIQNSKN